MKEQYYTPKESELFIGYECEIEYEEEFNKELNDFTPLYKPHVLTFEYGWLEIPKDFNERLRTKYLSKEDIESEGWILFNNDMGFPPFYKKGEFALTQRESNIYEIKKILFKTTGEYSKTHPTYIGNIKSINELRKLQEWLRIKS